MKHLPVVFLVCALAVAGGINSARGVDLLTYHNDNTRTGQNTNEIVLTLANVNTSSFGKLFTYSVDGYVYAQPLVMAGVTIPSKGVHNVLFVATEHDSVYAFDADNNSGANTNPLWQASFINLAAGISTVSSGDVSCTDIVPEIGITSTPVIDPVGGTLYVVAKTKEISGSVTNFVQRLHALEITTGAEKLGGPVVIQATVPGTGLGNNGEGQVPFDPMVELNRMGLLLNNHLIYFGFSQHCGNGGHGWVFTYNAQSLTQSNAFIDTPNGQQGGIWEAGCAPACDASNNVYLSTGNGTFDGLTNNDFGESLLKFSATNGVKLVDFFTPYNAQMLFADDLDLCSGGVILLPDSVGSVAHPHLVMCAGKQGTVYLVDRDHMGQFNAVTNSQIVEEMTHVIGGSFGTPAYFNNTIYCQGASDYLKAFAISNAVIGTNPISTSAAIVSWPGCTPVITASGTNDAIVWTKQTDAYGTPAILHAYNAVDLTQELYNSNQNGTQDDLGPSVKFTFPTVVNGRVYVGDQYEVSVFGLTQPPPAPAIGPAGGTFSNLVQVTLSDSQNGATIHYTLDGSVPGPASAVYTAPFFVTNSLTVTALATVDGGFTNSTASAANFTVITTTIASFSAAPTIGAAPLGVLFTDTSSGAITNRAWVFGDGAATNLSAISVIHVYTNVGLYSVSLTVAGPNGQATTNALNLIAVTNVVVDTTPPTIIACAGSETNLADGTGHALVPNFTSSVVATDNVTASDALVITQSPLAGTPAGVGSTPVTLIVQDAADNTATCATTFVVSPILVEPIITILPAVSNALAQVGSLAVVAAGQSNIFTVSSTDPSNLPLTYLWQFGDGQSNALAAPDYAYNTNCGPYDVTVTISTPYASVVTNLTVAVACDLSVTNPLGSLKATVDLAKPDRDSAHLEAQLDLGPGFVPFTPLDLNVTVDIGGAQNTFILDKNGKAKINASACHLTYRKPTKTKPGYWKLNLTLHKTTLQGDWAQFGVLNATNPQPGLPVTLPVVVVISNQAFAADAALHYLSKAGKSGALK